MRLLCESSQLVLGPVALIQLLLIHRLGRRKRFRQRQGRNALFRQRLGFFERRLTPDRFGVRFSGMHGASAGREIRPDIFMRRGDMVTHLLHHGRKLGVRLRARRHRCAIPLFRSGHRRRHDLLHNLRAAAFRTGQKSLRLLLIERIRI